MEKKVIAKLICIKTGKQYFITKHEISIGRANNNDIVINSQSVSKYHTQIYFEDSNFYIIDLKSLNGTFINHKYCYNKKMKLNHGDTIRFGLNKLTFTFYSSNRKKKKIRKVKTHNCKISKEKIEKDRNELKRMIKLGRKNNNRTTDVSSVNFPTSDGRLTVPLPNENFEKNKKDTTKNEYEYELIGDEVEHNYSKQSRDDLSFMINNNSNFMDELENQYRENEKEHIIMPKQKNNVIETAKEVKDLEVIPIIQKIEDNSPVFEVIPKKEEKIEIHSPDFEEEENVFNVIVPKKKNQRNREKEREFINVSPSKNKHKNNKSSLRTNNNKKTRPKNLEETSKIFIEPKLSRSRIERKRRIKNESKIENTKKVINNKENIFPLQEINEIRKKKINLKKVKSEKTFRPIPTILTKPKLINQRSRSHRNIINENKEKKDSFDNFEVFTTQKKLNKNIEKNQENIEDSKDSGVTDDNNFNVNEIEIEENSEILQDHHNNKIEEEVSQIEYEKFLIEKEEKENKIKSLENKLKKLQIEKQKKEEITDLQIKNLKEEMKYIEKKNKTIVNQLKIEKKEKKEILEKVNNELKMNDDNINNNFEEILEKEKKIINLQNTIKKLEFEKENNELKMNVDNINNNYEEILEKEKKIINLQNTIKKLEFEKEKEEQDSKLTIENLNQKLETINKNIKKKSKEIEKLHQNNKLKSKEIDKLNNKLKNSKNLNKKSREEEDDEFNHFNSDEDEEQEEEEEEEDNEDEIKRNEIEGELINTIYILSKEIENQLSVLSKNKDIKKNNKKKEFEEEEEEDKQIFITNESILKEIKKILKKVRYITFKKIGKKIQLSAASAEQIDKTSSKNNKRLLYKKKLENLKFKGIERYSKELSKKLIKYKVRNKELKEQNYNFKLQLEDPNLIEEFKNIISHKDDIISDLSNQISEYSASIYSNVKSKKRIQEICKNQLNELSKIKRENLEWRLRHKKKSLNWQKLFKLNSSLKYENEKLKKLFNNQNNNYELIISSKEKKLQNYRSQLSILSSSYKYINNDQPNNVNVNKEQINNRKNAAEFLVSEFNKSEVENSTLKINLKKNENKMMKYQHENNELKLECNKLKDIIQYNDIEKNSKVIDDLKNKVFEYEKIDNVNRVLKLQEYVEKLHLQNKNLKKYYKKIENDYINFINSEKIPIYDNTISFLEQKINEFEELSKEKKKKKKSSTTSNLKNEKKILEKLEKRNKTLRYILEQQQIINSSPKKDNEDDIEEEDHEDEIENKEILELTKQNQELSDMLEYQEQLNEFNEINNNNNNNNNNIPINIPLKKKYSQTEKLKKKTININNEKKNMTDILIPNKNQNKEFLKIDNNMNNIDDINDEDVEDEDEDINDIEMDDKNIILEKKNVLNPSLPFTTLKSSFSKSTNSTPRNNNNNNISTNTFYLSSKLKSKKKESKLKNIFKENYDLIEFQDY